MGISEFDFWSMTISEINRAIKSRERVNRINMQERACLDYIHAQLITKGVSIAFGAKESFPKFSEVYSSLLKEDKEAQATEEKLQNAKDELSTVRLQMFAQSFNKRFEEV